MKVIYTVIAAGAVLAATAGCKQGTATAPAKPGADPDATRKLTVKSPGEQNVTRDQTDDMTVSVDRDNFAGPIEVDLRNLPKGVTVVTKEMIIPAGKDSLTVTVRAAPDAPAVDNHKVQLVARAKDQRDMKEAVTEFDLDVKAKD